MCRTVSDAVHVLDIIVGYEQGKLAHQSIDRSDYGYDHIA